ncbi:BatD family protein [uncultured Rikenella sp.]|uniref:BatD family protein n=1 Tax=uncultured Rikenella sp. TaxID=368003 RepID=UPI002631A498|nr:BatD family protein [uncultured Rikenella sp.]
MQKINKYLRLLAAFAALLLVCGREDASAQGNAEFEVNAPLRVAEGQQFRIEYTASSADDIGSAQFGAPDMPAGLSVLSGPVKSVGVFMSSVNGKVENRHTLTFTYWVQAGGAGKITVPPATLVFGGKTYSTKATVIECVSGHVPQGQGGGSSQQPGAETLDKSALAAGDILLRMEVNKTEAYKGEPIVASLKIYTQVNIAGFENIKYPALNGFWAQEMDVSGQGDSRATIGGKVYHSQILRQWLLYPQRSGTLEIEQAQFTAIAQLVTQTPSTGSPYDLFFGGAPQVRNVSAKLASPAVKIRVRELPQPQPAGFTGAVGQFDLTGMVSGDRFAANSAGAVTLKLSGTGNFPLVEAPQIALPAAFEQFDTKTSEKLASTARGTTGEKSYEFPFIARAEGDYVIPGVQFSYFDPSTGQYHTLNTPEFPIEILRDEGGGTSGLGMVSGVTKEDLKMLGSDIRFIRTGDPELMRRGRAFLWSWSWFAVAVLLAAAFGGLLFYLRKSIRERADIVRVRTKKANKVALRRLKRAKTYMNAGKESAFFEEMLRALWGYMGDKLAIDVADLTKERVQQVLTGERGIPEEQAREFLGLISECEFAQYTPSSGVQMDKAYQAALDQIGRFENKI